MVRSPFRFINPPKTPVPISTSLGTDSPVRLEVSTMDLPSITLPSRGTFSPGFTIIISLIFTSSGDTFFNSLPIFKLA